MLCLMICLAVKKHFYLHVASRHGSVEAIKVFLEYFDANGQNSHGKLLIEVANLHDQVEAVKILHVSKNCKQLTKI